MESEVLVAEVAPQVLSQLQALLAELYIPLVASQQPARRQAESAKDEFVQVGRRRMYATGPDWVCAGGRGRVGVGGQGAGWGRLRGCTALQCRVKGSTATLAAGQAVRLVLSGALGLPAHRDAASPAPAMLAPSCPAAQGATKLVSVLAEATASSGAEDALPLPPAELLASVMGPSGTAKSLSQAAADPELVARFSALLASWCATLEAVLAAGEAAMAGKDAEDAGAQGRLFAPAGQPDGKLCAPHCHPFA